MMKTSSQNYSPFWAIMAVFLTLSFLQAMNLKNMLEQRKSLEETRAQMQKASGQAITIKNTIESLGKDLLSMTNKEAQQIVADFKIAPNVPK